MCSSRVGLIRGVLIRRFTVLCKISTLLYFTADIDTDTWASEKKLSS